MKLFIVLISAALLSGCSVLKKGDFFSLQVGTKRIIDEASLEMDSTNKVTRLHLRGYKSDNSQVAESAVRGAVSAFLGRYPVPVEPTPTSTLLTTSKKPEVQEFEGKQYVLIQEPNGPGEGIYVWRGVADGKSYTRADGKMILLP